MPSRLIQLVPPVGGGKAMRLGNGGRRGWYSDYKDLFDLWLKKYTLLVLQVINEWCHENIDAKEVSEQHMNLPLCLEFQQLLSEDHV